MSPANDPLLNPQSDNSTDLPAASYQPGQSFHPQPTDAAAPVLPQSTPLEPASNVPAQPEVSVEPPTPPISEIPPSVSVTEQPEVINNPLISGASGETGSFGTAIAATPSSKRKLSKKIILIGALLFLLLLGGGAFAYLNYLMPKNVLRGYLLKTAKTKTSEFKSTIHASNAPDSNAPAIFDNIRIEGKYDVNNTKEPKVELKVKVEMEGSNAEAQLRFIKDTLFLKLNSLGLLEGFGVKISDDWYKYTLEEANQQFGGTCSKDDVDKSASLLGQRYLTRLPTKDTKLVKLFDKVDGHRARHFKGAVDIERVGRVIEDANKELPANCKIDFSKEEFGHYELSYDLWTSNNFDRLDLKILEKDSKDVITISIDTFNYNKPITIEEPASAKDLKEILNDLYGDDATTTTSGSTPATGTSTPGVTASNKDDTRKSDIKNIQQALETYYTDEAAYPSSLEILKPNYINAIPRDPNGSTYQYIPTNCTGEVCGGYTLSTDLENKNDPAAKDGKYTVNSINQI